jgi:hypothetical protein
VVSVSEASDILQAPVVAAQPAGAHCLYRASTPTIIPIFLNVAIVRGTQAKGLFLDLEQGRLPEVTRSGKATGKYVNAAVRSVSGVGSPAVWSDTARMLFALKGEQLLEIEVNGRLASEEAMAVQAVKLILPRI